MGAAEDKALVGNGSVSAKCVQNGLPPGRVCFVTALQADSVNGYPDVRSAVKVVIMRRQSYPSQSISL